MLALFAEQKPDCVSRREVVKSKIVKYEGEDNIIPVEETGATLLDVSNKILSVEGSRYQHAAVVLCARFPAQCRNGTICLSRVPCSVCLKHLIQRYIDTSHVPSYNEIFTQISFVFEWCATYHSAKHKHGERTLQTKA